MNKIVKQFENDDRIECKVNEKWIKFFNYFLNKTTSHANK